MNQLAARLDRVFAIHAAGSTLSREITGGLTTFATMSYIIFVQPTVLSAAGMDFGGVLLATCLASAFASILMGLYAKYPYALAPGMGQNFLFAFTICSAFEGGMGFSWQAGLAIVFLSGLIFLALSLFRVREHVLTVLPDCLKHAIGPAIGLFIAFVGLQWSGIIRPHPATIVQLGDLTQPATLVSLAGLGFVVLCLARGIRGGILLGILFTVVCGLLSGVLQYPEETAAPNASTVLQFNFGALLSRWDAALIAILLVFFLDLFDTVGTFVGVSQQAGFVDEHGTPPRAGRVFASDAASSCAGACLGVSTVTTYIESAAGVAAGARTGLAAVVTGLCFVAAIPFAPLVQIAGQDVGPQVYGVSPTAPHVAMYPAVAPALIAVGLMMMKPLTRIDWDDYTEALPAFLTVLIMPLAFGIAEGIAAGCASYAAVKLLAGRYRDVHPIMLAIGFAVVLRYVFLL